MTPLTESVVMMQLRTKDFGPCTITNGFDAILSNPPYIDSERMKKSMPDYRSDIAAKWSSARGNWDLFVPFIELGVELLRPHGRAGFLTPIKLFGADYCATIQAKLLNHHIVSAKIWDAVDAFEHAIVAVMTCVIEKNGTGPCHFQQRISQTDKSCVLDNAALATLPKGH